MRGSSNGTSPFLVHFIYKYVLDGLSPFHNKSSIKHETLVDSFFSGI